MSIIDQVLISIDDSPLSKDDLETIFSSQKTSVLFSSVGRLLGRDCISVSGKGDTTRYYITKKGSLLIKESLNSLRDVADNVSHIWMLVAVSIPEKYKVEREKVRFILKDNGFGLIRSGLYVGNISNKEKLIQKINENCRYTDVTYFTLDEIPKSILENPDKIWSTKSVQNSYSQWMHDVKKFIDSVPSDLNMRRILSKIHVYSLSSIVRRDSKIMQSKYAHKIGRTESLKLYEKIRDYCYR